MVDIKKYMSDSDDAINLFARACDDLISSKYILADIKIAAVLQIIASNSKLYDLFEQVLKNFDILEEFHLITDTANGQKSLRLPDDKGRSVAFVFCLLLDFDTGRRKLKDFLSEYFPSDDPSANFTQFTSGFIVPFKRNTQVLYFNKADVLSDYRPDSFFDDESEKPIDAAAVEFVVAIMRDVVALVEREPTLNMAERDELLAIAEGLSNTIATKNTRLIKILHIGFRNTVKQSKMSKQLANLLDELNRKIINVV